MISWIAATISLTGLLIVSLGKPERMVLGMTIYLAASIVWAIYAYNTGQNALLAMNVVYLGVKLNAIIQWYNRDK